MLGKIYFSGKKVKVGPENKVHSNFIGIIGSTLKEAGKPVLFKITST